MGLFEFRLVKSLMDLMIAWLGLFQMGSNMIMVSFSFNNLCLFHVFFWVLNGKLFQSYMQYLMLILETESLYVSCHTIAQVTWFFSLLLIEPALCQSDLLVTNLIASRYPRIFLFCNIFLPTIIYPRLTGMMWLVIFQ